MTLKNTAGRSRHEEVGPSRFEFVIPTEDDGDGMIIDPEAIKASMELYGRPISAETIGSIDPEKSWSTPPVRLSDLCHPDDLKRLGEALDHE